MQTERQGGETETERQELERHMEAGSRVRQAVEKTGCMEKGDELEA